MCGIAGFVHRETDSDVRLKGVLRMCDAMTRRGPDDHGTRTLGPCTLGMRRLAIFDPAHGRQPMSTADGRFHIVFNGAIYNFRELGRELSCLGASFSSQCDTEVLLQGFAHWGPGVLPRLRGMFAFAVWDTRDESLFLARDPFGVKPLYFSQPDGQLLFASESRALIASGRVSAEPDRQGVSDCLSYLAPTAPRTVFAQIRSLRPGECATWSNGVLSSRLYWRVSDKASPETPLCPDRGTFISELRARLDDSIRAHSLADVPVGAFLSGGLDSAAIVGLMSRHQSAPLKTFSIGFAEAGYSETEAAAATARHFGTAHQEYVLHGEKVAEDIETILSSLDQPTGDAINTYYASQLAKAGGVTVALSGLGGDELFGGYPWFRTTPRLARLLPFWRALPAPLRRHVAARLRSGDARDEKLADILTHAGNLHEVASLQRRSFGEQTRQSLLQDAPDYAPHEQLAVLTSELRTSDPFSVVSAWELRSYMADVLLRDSDVMSMRHSLELRVPFVDVRLFEWYWAQRPEFKTSPGRIKAPLADAVADLLPPGQTRRPKQGFSLPMNHWMRGPLKPFLEETFSSVSVERSGCFVAPKVQARWRAFVSRNDPREWSRIWSLGVLIAYLNRSRRP